MSTTYLQTPNDQDLDLIIHQTVSETLGAGMQPLSVASTHLAKGVSVLDVPLLRESIFEWRWNLMFSNEGNIIHFVRFHLCIPSSDMDKSGHNQTEPGSP
ncbi:hypothetical protein llap_7346 [Limosa lapponica baueri]|uniref:Uncharacterized protein n=1 Tax=Limosa lapponica baueri TaxID=1758121 RepID=A0A2I0U8G1_LIMLA|nr:hypothetical protein llap_7346 [Limosa lapponica baueri]